uniref:Uncharacterized protein n=1 Tax=Arundo donax TaxID=35708 RepID=A0A0A8ZCW0_ARUDO
MLHYTKHNSCIPWSLGLKWDGASVYETNEIRIQVKFCNEEKFRKILQL